MSIFGQIATAKTQSRGVKINEKGEFVVRLDSIRTQQSNRQFGLLWVVEFTILKGTMDNPPGAKRSWVQQPERRAQTDLGNIKSFVAACRGEDPETMAIPEEEYERIQSDAQPFKGKVMRLLTEPITTQGGFDFVVHMWETHVGEVPQVTDEQVAAAAAADTAAAPPPAAVPSAPAPAAPAAAPPALTKEAWIGGAGDGQTHPNNPQYEWHPEHPDWGVREKRS